jgi:hypothetical protein
MIGVRCTPTTGIFWTWTLLNVDVIDDLTLPVASRMSEASPVSWELLPYFQHADS